MTQIPNPIVIQRADPCVLKAGSQYLFTGSHPQYDRIVLRRAPELADLQSANEVVVWRRHDSGPMSHLIWAPEIHHINGKWYIYFAAAPNDTSSIDQPGANPTFNHRIFALENSSPDPLSDNWIERGQVDTGWESFALDATSFELGGRQYLVWAQQDLAVRGHSNIYIAPMANPWTLEGPALELSRPEFEWEQRGFWVNEGPAVLVWGDTIYLTYSGAATGVDYAIGLLTTRIDANLLDPAAWTKRPDPIMVSNTRTGQYGPGHNTFTCTHDGKPVIVYHARNYTTIEGDPLWDPNRHARAQILTIDDHGTLAWPTPSSDTRPTPSHPTKSPDQTGLV